MARTPGPHEFTRPRTCRLPVVGRKLKDGSTGAECSSFGSLPAPLRDLACTHCGLCMGCVPDLARCPKAPEVGTAAPDVGKGAGSGSVVIHGEPERPEPSLSQVAA